MSPEEFEALTGQPLESFAHQCHAAAHALVQAGEGERVLRGSCPGVRGQHSWVLVSGGVYDYNARIIDPTLWSYRDDIDGIFEGPAATLGHRPHGAGSIYLVPPPPEATGKPIALAPAAATRLSREARDFLRTLPPLDARGWMVLSGGPMEGWPAGEILAAMHATPALRALPPIDRVGMLTDVNPSGLYLRTKETSNHG